MSAKKKFVLYNRLSAKEVIALIFTLAVILGIVLSVYLAQNSKEIVPSEASATPNPNCSIKFNQDIPSGLKFQKGEERVLKADVQTTYPVNKVIFKQGPSSPRDTQVVIFGKSRSKEDTQAPYETKVTAWEKGKTYIIAEAEVQAPSGPQTCLVKTPGFEVVKK